MAGVRTARPGERQPWGSSRADIVSVHLVLSGRTRGLVGAAELALMKRTAYNGIFFDDYSLRKGPVKQGGGRNTHGWVNRHLPKLGTHQPFEFRTQIAKPGKHDAYLEPEAEERPINIGARCFIRGGAVGEPGVSIGDDCIIGAGMAALPKVSRLSQKTL